MRRLVAPTVRRQQPRYPAASPHEATSLATCYFSRPIKSKYKNEGAAARGATPFSIAMCTVLFGLFIHKLGLWD